MRAAFGLLRAIAWVLALSWSLPAAAQIAPPAADDPALEARVLRIADELRCLVCQNQSISDSHAGLAIDLRNQIRDMLRQGRSEAQIRDYMVERYGDFVLYRPPVKAKTWLLWFGPLLLMALGASVLAVVLRKRRAADEAPLTDAQRRAAAVLLSDDGGIR